MYFPLKRIQLFLDFNLMKKKKNRRFLTVAKTNRYNRRIFLPPARQMILIALESIAPRSAQSFSIILDGIFKYLEKAYSPRFLSVITVTARSIERREEKKEKRKKKRKRKRVHSRDATETFPELTRTSSLWRNRDQRLLVNRRSRYRFNLQRCGLYVKRFRLTIGRFQGRLVCINWTNRVQYFRVSVRISSSHAEKKHRSSKKLADFSFIPVKGERRGM